MVLEIEHRVRTGILLALATANLANLLGLFVLQPMVAVHELKV